jgi:putative transposase
MMSVAAQSRERPFWQRRHYDFNVCSEKKRIEKLLYIHRNPVVRGLAARPEDWEWSSFRHYAIGREGTVEIESFWTAARRGGLPGRFRFSAESHISSRYGAPELWRKNQMCATRPAMQRSV